MIRYQYAIYGVSLQSDIAFDFPCDTGAGNAAARVVLRRGTDDEFARFRPTGAAIDDRIVCQAIADDALYLRSSTFFEFVIDASGTRVRYRPLRDGNPAVLQNFVIGQALSIAMVRQGLEPLHAAVIDAGGAAFALLGDCTFGKSTLAASFLGEGCRLVTDDLLVVGEQQGAPVALPGTGRMKLLPDSAHAVLGGSSRGVPLHAGSAKRAYRLDPGTLFRQPASLRACFVLPAPDERAGSRQIAATPMTAAELFHALVTNTFVTVVDDRRRLRRNFASNARLASSVAGYRLRYPSGLDRLPEVRRMILACVGMRANRSQAPCHAQLPECCRNVR